jgi:glycosyltransferase involved in cell wall biosynthesis
VPAIEKTARVPDRIRVARLPATSDGNPYQRVLYERLRRHGVDLVDDARPALSWLLRNRRRFDVLHVHWRLDRLFRLADDGLGGERWSERAHPVPVAALRLLRLAAMLRLARALGIRVAWTVHEPWACRPDGPWLDHRAGRIVARAADVLMAHDHGSAELATRYLRPRRRVTVLPLPSYAELVPPPRLGAGARLRRELGVREDDVLVLAFGVLRPEKGYALLLDALARLPAARIRVLVAGMSRSEEVVAMLRAGAGRDARLTLEVGWVDEQRAADLHAAADVFVLARSVEWTSASTVLALSQGVPVVAADLRSNAEPLGPGAWLFRPGDAASLAARLEEAIEAGPAARAARGAAGRAHVGRWDFDALAAATALELRGLPPVEARGFEPAAIPVEA